MFWLKACPRCGGDLNAERDRDGAYVACLQCGHVLTSAQEALLLRTVRGSAKSMTAAALAQR